MASQRHAYHGALASAALFSGTGDLRPRWEGTEVVHPEMQWHFSAALAADPGCKKIDSGA